jgi:hypothetical protein
MTIQTEVIMTQNLWLSKAELVALPTFGAAWTKLLAAADSNAGTVSLDNQDSNNNVLIMAKALVYARTGTAKYLADVVAALRTIAMGKPAIGRALALGRELCAYVLSADLIDLETLDPSLNIQFKTAIRGLLTTATSGGPSSLVQCHDDRPNNWGTHAGASRIAVALYLGDTAELNAAADVFHGWLGYRASYDNFTYGDLTWQADPAHPVGVNPVNATIQGHNVSGSLPDDMRRAGAFTWPPAKTDYAWEGLQGALVQAQLLTRAGYPAWEWEDKALLRAVTFLYSINWPAAGDDTWQPWLVNAAYGSTFPTSDSAGYGKNIGWTSWTHAKAGVIVPPVDPPPPPTTGTDVAKIAAATVLLKKAKTDLAVFVTDVEQALAALG